MHFSVILCVLSLIICDRISIDAQNLVRNYVGDLEADMTVPQIIRHWGYPAEIHKVTTADGYVLELHRIPRGRNDLDSNRRRPVVFLQHGLLCTSSVWVMNLPHQSAGFMFADAGFDVWLGNMRGNSYSRGHVKQNIRRSAYWSFSWDHMAKYDLEAMIDYVLNATKRDRLYYVGHSQGTLTMFSKLSLNDGFNRKIEKFFAIAPVGTITYVKGLFRYLGERMYEQLLVFTAIFGDQEFLPNTIISRWLTEFVCGLYTTNPLCENFLFLVSGPDSMQLNKTRIGIYLAHNPAGTSIRNILHYCQMVRHHRQQAYDYGKEGNLRNYAKPSAQEYDISRIQNVPIHLFYSESDWLATSQDVEKHLLRRIDRRLLAGVHKLDDFNHNDFLWGLRAAKEVYLPIIDEIRRGESDGMWPSRRQNGRIETTTPGTIGFKLAPFTGEDGDLIYIKS
ncbi:alpha/beta-hydrolase lipase region domain-containing protein [Ditylenchus destructor]|nr:alpha/beta-hydrolase lipase region domain-containing protein [Ditylenchus destructor]